jgi:N-carbamoyl-L-amino-acid hydrolase
MSLSRRDFLGRTAGLIAGSTVGLRAMSNEPATQPRVSGARLREHLEVLSAFGRPSGGRFVDGVTRIAYSDADQNGRGYIMRLMTAIGLEPRIDPAGNIFARRTGRNGNLPPILFGSHIDSVPNGGNFDGDLGSLAAIEAVQTIVERRVETDHPLEVVVWANEEGVAYGNGDDGSRAVVGELAPGELDLVWNGMKKADAIRKIGGDPDRIAAARRDRGAWHCYLELHIEQGGVLDRSKVPIGVVDGIVAIGRYEVTVRGVANHAGTTPMPDRHDALASAARLVLAVEEIVKRDPGHQVGTVGRLEVAPNAPNVVPGVVRMSIELRDLSPEKIVRLAAQIEAQATSIAAATRTTIEIGQIGHDEAALAHPDVQTAIERSADALSLDHVHLPSGAGHDAQMIARIAPMGMIFVPSIGGISHAPTETTTWQHCEDGANVLLRTVLAVDNMVLRL